ncbi:esterase-like activity of phytase family protein [Pelagerythrobacter sp.]|uniref:esterase-like activity of phytase family protein n=1 Tax=Pelagerythrobacter sp. TaxID=2800702 RepID=UPI0035AF58DE
MIVALLAAPGTWLRTPVSDDFRPILAITPVAVEQRRTGDFTLEGVWELASGNAHFGGYSALLALPDGRLLAASDRGRYLRFAPPGAAPRPPEFGAIGGGVELTKYLVDVEAMTGDPARERIWLAYEGSNTIARYGPALTEGETVAPSAMRGWSSNSGPESLARMADGRFLVLEEGRPGSRPDHRALLFPGDPVAGAEPAQFRYLPPEGFRPVDAAPLPDGRVLILHRKVALDLPSPFTSAIALADPRTIRAGGEWHGEVIGTIAEQLPRDNFEGIAVAPGADGGLTVWLISDDNNSAFQRTLLYELRLDLPGS